jgi:hypothetical protein
MEITTKFAPGDKAWTYDHELGKPVLSTVGQVRVSITDSPGTGESMFDNYGPQKGREERYMCIETGIGSGSVYTLGEHIFDSEAECASVYAEAIAEQQREKERVEIRQRNNLIAEEADLRARLARIEQMKSTGAA